VTEVVIDQNVGATEVSKLPLIKTSADCAGRFPIKNSINIKTGVSTGIRPNSLTADSSKSASLRLARQVPPNSTKPRDSIALQALSSPVLSLMKISRIIKLIGPISGRFFAGKQDLRQNAPRLIALGERFAI
jgi:hypothetical protein